MLRLISPHLDLNSSISYPQDMNDDNWSLALTQGVEHIARDSQLQPYTLLFPQPTFLPHDAYYQELVESIISQQLSVKAAATITKRFVELFGGAFPRPEQILEKDSEQLRGVGLSGQKASYIQDLASRILDGSLHFNDITAMSNDDIIVMLTAVKGIGEWTAHMFLMFSLGRLDVLAHGDLGIRNGIKQLYALDHVPSPDEVKQISQRYNWHPYESIACWYIWKSLDNEPKQT